MSTQKDEPKLGFRNVVMLGYVSLFTDVSTEMILGVLPLFIVINLGASPAILGLIEGVAEAVNYGCRVVTGVLTDKLGKRKVLVLIGYGLSTVAKPLFAVASSWGQALAIRTMDRAGKGARTSPRDALISDSVAKSQSGKAFGTHSSMDQIGAVAGPLLAFALIPLIGIRGIFWVSFIPSLISLVILLFFVKEKHRIETTSKRFQKCSFSVESRFCVIAGRVGDFLGGSIRLFVHTVGSRRSWRSNELHSFSIRLPEFRDCNYWFTDRSFG